FISVLTFLIPVAQMLLLIVLVPWLMQDEPAVGTSAFWFTRPMTPEFVLTSKALFIAAVILAPQIALELLLMAINGIAPIYLALAIPEILLKTLAFILPLAVVAAITPSIGSYALWLISAFIALAILSTIGVYFFVFVGDETFAPARTSGTLASSSQIVSGLIYLVAGSALVLWQYRTRSTRQTVIAAVVILIVAFNTSLFWRFDFFHRALPPAESDPAMAPATLLADGRNLHATRINPLRSREPPQRELSLDLHLAPLPLGLWATPERVNATAQFDGGTEFQDQIQFSSVASESNDLIRALLPQAFPGATLIGQSTPGPALCPVIRLPENEATRLAHLPFRLNLDVQWLLLDGTIHYQIPLRPGLHFQDGTRQETIRNISRLGPNATVTLLIRDIRLLLAPDLQPSDSPLAPGNKPVIYGLYHPQRREFWPGKAEFDWQAGIFQGRIFIARPQVIFFNWRSHEPSPISDQWLENAELVRITVRPRATLTRSLTLDDLRIIDAN
ncbi:MAG: hypothetical protein SNJ84_04770, partial [Verrucomicrobiia bacterium]